MLSKGEASLHEVLREEFPHHRIFSQFTIKVGRKSLFLDYYIPVMKLAFEYDGQQHAEFNGFFHRTQKEFENSVNNDRLKEEWCASHNVTLIRINHKERTDISTLRGKIKTAATRRHAHR